MTHPPVTAPSPAARSVLLRRWPSLVAIGLTALVAYDMSEGADLAPALAASAFVYVGAAALGRPSAAWAVFLGVFAVIGATEVLGGGEADPTWIVLALAVPFLLPALRRGEPRQVAALAGFGAAAALALGASETVGAYLVAGGLLGHAAWDAYHHRADAVVARSYAEVCLVLDTLLAAAVVVVTVNG